MQTQHMDMVGRRGLWIAEQATQQRNGVPQGGASFVRLTVGPQERVQLAPLMHAPLDRQVEQQGLRFAQGKGEAVVATKNIGGAEHRQTEQTQDKSPPPPGSQGKTPS